MPPPCCRSCRCKKSMCLKLYCDCFAAGAFCGACSCSGCLNRPEHEEKVKQRREDIVQRDPHVGPPPFGPHCYRHSGPLSSLGLTANALQVASLWILYHACGSLCRLALTEGLCIVRVSYRPSRARSLTRRRAAARRTTSAAATAGAATASRSTASATRGASSAACTASASSARTWMTRCRRAGLPGSRGKTSTRYFVASGGADVTQLLDFSDLPRAA